MKIITFKELQPGDIVVVQVSETEVELLKVEAIDAEAQSFTYHNSLLDCCIQNPDEIVVLDEYF